MSDSGGVNVSKTGLISGLLIALAFCLLWIGYGLLESGKYQRQADDNSREYARYTGDKVAEACVRISPLEKVKCLNEAIDAQRQYEANQQDLVAQKQSALWAYIMGAAAVLGMALSAVGVWLVKTTFDETRKSNEIALMAQRPWLDVEIELSGIARSKNGYDFRMAIKVKNVGLSPAIHLRYAVEGFFSHDVLNDDAIEFGNVRDKLNEVVGGAVERVEAKQSLSKADGLTIFPNDPSTIYLVEEIRSSHADADSVLAAWFVIGLRYSFSGGDGRTVRIFNSPINHPNQTGFDFIGEYGEPFTDINGNIRPWESGGYAT
jgi:hypothetical protein